jgi:hypothetical protein
VEGESLLIRLFSRDRPPQVSLDRRVLSVRRPTTVVRYVAHRAEPRVTAGQPGYDVVLYRVFSGQEGQRELVSRDSYPAQNRVVWR